MKTHSTFLMLFSMLVVLCLPKAAEAQWISFYSGQLAYYILSEEDHTVEVCEMPNAYSGNISIPATVTHDNITYDVVALGESSFEYAHLSGISIPSSVVQIKDACFRYATMPSTINLPASVAIIGEGALSGEHLNNIQVDTNNPYFCSVDGVLYSKDTSTLVAFPTQRSGSVTLMQQTHHIGPYAFSYCQNLTGINLHEGLLTIGEGAFTTAIHLTSITIPSTVKYIGPNPFGHCSNLGNIEIAQGNSHYYLDGFLLYSADGDTLLSAHRSPDSLYLPASLRVVYGFLGNRYVRYVHLPDSVNTIGPDAFCYSTLKSIDMPIRMKMIDEYAFYYCDSLTRVVMPEYLEQMGIRCFALSMVLPSISIPNGLHRVPKETFVGCMALQYVSFGDDIELIDTSAFYTTILNAVQLPASVRVIRNYAFASDEYLDPMTIDCVIFSGPVDTIESEAFYFRHINFMRLKNTTPPVTTDLGLFSGASVDSISIPCGSMETYMADSYWTTYADQCQEDCSAIGDVKPAAQPTVYPNPAANQLTIEATSGCRRIELMDMTGRTVLMRTVEGDQVDLDVSSLARGTYFLRLIAPSNSETRKVVIK